MVCSRMIKLYTAVIPDYGGIFFYIAKFLFLHTDNLHEAALKWTERPKEKKKEQNKTRQKHLCLQTEGQHLACIILEVVEMLNHWINVKS